MINNHPPIDIAIVIITYNAEKYILNCVNSIKKYDDQLSYEILVIDNASQDSTIRKLESEYKDLTIIRNDLNKGFAKACNQGLSLTNSKYVFFLNPDTFLFNNVFQIFFSYMESPGAKNVWCCGAQLLDENNELIKSHIDFPTLWDVLLEQSGLRGIQLKLKSMFYKRSEKTISDNQKIVPSVNGCNMFIRRSVLDKIGTFNESFFLNYEETELALRAQQTGYNSVILNDARIIHYGSKSFKNKKEYLNHLRDGQLKYFKVTKPFFYRLPVKALHLIGTILRIIFKLDFSQFQRIQKIISA